MRKRFLVIILAIIVAMFVFVPWGKTIAANFGGGPEFVGWVSPSFALFGCGAATGNYPIQAPYVTFVNTGSKPFWSSFWNCDYPHL